MRRISSRLNDSGASVLIVAGVMLMLALCVCVLLPRSLTPEFGLMVRPENTGFALGEYNRAEAHIISVTAGETPLLYDGPELLKNGFRELEERMNQWRAAAESPQEVTVILVVDKAVAAGTAQRLTEMVLKAGFRCAYAAVPEMSS